MGRLMFLAGFFHLFVETQASAQPLKRISAICSAEARSCQVGDWNAAGSAARASLNPSQNETGWGTLFVEGGNGSDELVAFAAGYSEGVLTANLIQSAWATFAASGPLPSDAVTAFVSKQANWVRSKVRGAAASGDEDAVYWRSVGLVYEQMDGIAAGYEAAAAEQALKPLSVGQIMLLGMNTELDDIQKSIDPSTRPDYDGMTDDEFFSLASKTGHCSALFRVTPALDDLLAAHTTWTSYFWMLRIYKVYKLSFSSSQAETVMLSGYPGMIPSGDDFFTTSQKLVVIETTNEVFNHSLYDLIVPESVPYWVRVTVATRAAATAKAWHETFYKYNSGTYNNQWMVADYKQFVPGQPLIPWTFVVSEQLPDPHAHPGEDLTMVLARGHWASYNVPYFEDVYTVSGYPDMVKRRGPEASYQLAPRAPLFRRDAERVNSMEDMHHFMRLNSFGSGDPLAKTACHAIACRGDLLLKDAGAFGATDAKAVNRDFMESMAVSAISGPTTQDQPAFSFSGRWSEVPHYGMPATFDFDWQTISLVGLQGQSTSDDMSSIVV